MGRHHAPPPHIPPGASPPPSASSLIPHDVSIIQKWKRGDFFPPKRPEILGEFTYSKKIMSSWGTGTK